MTSPDGAATHQIDAFFIYCTTLVILSITGTFLHQFGDDHTGTIVAAVEAVRPPIGGQSARYNVRSSRHCNNLHPSTMSPTDTILANAQQRMHDHHLPYAGAVTPQEAYALLQANPNARLVDVRTNAERDWVGRVAIAPEQHLAIQWSLYPGGTQNPDFLQQLQQMATKDTPLLFLCRSGVRSRHAAKLATEAGYTQCFDILEGFEGDKDADGHRKSIGGWCKAGLPWLGA
jgi:rhodanese-related sulfurtransferase